MTTLLLVRHARSTANAQGILAGWMPEVQLDPIGTDQVATLTQRLTGLEVGAVVTSPLARCRATAAAFTGVEPVADDRFGEVRYGAWTGRPLKELADEPLWQVIQQRPHEAAFPASEQYEAESLAGVRDRAMAALTEWDAEVSAKYGDDAVWAVVSHGDVIKALLAEALGSGLEKFQRIMVDPASVSVLHLGKRPAVWRVNDSSGSLAALATTKPGRTGTAIGGGDVPGDGAQPADSTRVVG